MAEAQAASAFAKLCIAICMLETLPVLLPYCMLRSVVSQINGFILHKVTYRLAKTARGKSPQATMLML